MIDVKLSFKEQLDYTRREVAKTTSFLGRVMTNIETPKYSRRQLIARMLKSILLYAAPVPAGALNKIVNHHHQRDFAMPTNWTDGTQDNIGGSSLYHR